MLISVPIVILGSHLVVMVADNAPRFDIARGCRLDNKNRCRDTWRVARRRHGKPSSQDRTTEQMWLRADRSFRIRGDPS